MEETRSSTKKKNERRAATSERLIRFTLAKEEEPIILRLQDQNNNVMQSYQTGRNVRFEHVFRDYCDRRSFVYEEVRFLFDGKRVHGEDTPEKFEMEDDDIIDVMYDQLAGGNAHLL